jgi:DNA repair exonuclease SbcCD ATPase subunit
MKAYFKEEYDDIKMFGDPTNRRMETINSATEGTEVLELLEEIRRDAMVGNEQIQQMATSFKGATDTMSEVMDRLKTALDQIKVLTATNKTLVESNKQLTDTIKALGGKAAAKPPEKEERAPTPSIKESNPDGEVCPICDKVHQKPFKDYCCALAKNAHLVPKRGRRGAGN